MRYIGIDPGLFGAIAVLSKEDGDPEWIPMPLMKAGKRREIDEGAVRDYLYERSPAMVAIEKVGSMPKQGVASSFNFGTGWGLVRGICTGLRLPYVLIQPQAWKKKILIGLGTDKSATLRYCMRRWPEVPLVAPGCRVPHDGAADALCLALYGKLST